MRKPLALIVEDADELGDTFAEIFREETDMQIEVIQDGHKALERILATAPELVLLDIHLPHVSGLEILDRIRDDPRLAATKVVVITADMIRAEEAKGKADMVLVKPIGFDQISELTRWVIEHT